MNRREFLKFPKKHWIRIVVTTLAAAVIFQFITAYFWGAWAGKEILWQIPLVVILTTSVWLASKEAR